MDYRSIIQDNKNNHSAVSWWPNFAYHYTDITNAVGILKSGKLYSRKNAKKLNLMNNDNASRQVIDITNTAIIDSVRLYFRPLTPTQYYNEGFKHKDIRYHGDEYANVPVPVFFAFDLEKVLSIPGVKFSEGSQAGTGNPLKSGVEEFSKLDFDKIYSDGYSENFEEENKFRHSEIVCSDSLDISECLNSILCRNIVEKTSLLNMLKNADYKAYNFYKDRIKVCKENMFEKNGLFINNIIMYDNILTFEFSDTYYKERYKHKQMEKNGIDSLSLIKSSLELDWINQHKKSYYKTMMDIELNYDKKKLTVKIPKIESATVLHIKLFFEGNLMCDVEQSINTSQIM